MRVGMEKVLSGPASEMYVVSSLLRWGALSSEFGSGLECGKLGLKSVEPESGRDLGFGRGLGMAPTLAPTACSCRMLIVGLPLFCLTTSSGSHSVLPTLVTTSTPDLFAASTTASSLSLAYASVSFSNTKCVIRHSLNNLGSTVCGASRTTKSLELGFSSVMEADRSLMQSRRNCQRLGPTRAR